MRRRSLMTGACIRCETGCHDVDTNSVTGPIRDGLPRTARWPGFAHSFVITTDGFPDELIT